MMILKDMLKTLRIHGMIEIRTEDNRRICFCGDDIEDTNIKHYINCEVKEWFPYATPYQPANWCVLLKIGDN